MNGRIYKVEWDGPWKAHLTSTDGWFDEWATSFIARGEKATYDFRTIFTIHGRQWPPKTRK